MLLARPRFSLVAFGTLLLACGDASVGGPEGPEPVEDDALYADGRFTNAGSRLPTSVHDSEDVGIADFDGDGLPDLYLASRGSADRLLLRLPD